MLLRRALSLLILVMISFRSVPLAKETVVSGRRLLRLQPVLLNRPSPAGTPAADAKKEPPEGRQSSRTMKSMSAAKRCTIRPPQG